MGKQLNSFNENPSVKKVNKSSEVATTSSKPNKRSTGANTVRVNSTRHTSRTNVSGEEDSNSDSSQGETDMRKTKRKRLLFKCQRSKTQTRETSESVINYMLSLYGVSDLDDQIDTTHIANTKG